MLNNTVVPTGRTHLNLDGATCVADAAGLVTVYVIVSLIHGVNVPVRAVIAVGVGTPYLNVVENAVPAKEIQRQITIVERRQSQLQIRSPEKIEGSTV